MRGEDGETSRCSHRRSKNLISHRWKKGNESDFAGEKCSQLLANNEKKLKLL